jgi:trehalose-6-phosphatase
MTRPANGSGNNWFFRQVARARERTLFLNHDALFSQGSPDRSGSDLDPDVLELLARAMRHTRLIAITSLPAHEAASQIALQPAPEIWGNDGLERLTSDGKYECQDLNVPLELLRALSDYESQLDKLGFGNLVEVKLTGLIVRWKALPAAEQLEIHTKAYGILQQMTSHHNGVRIAAHKDGLELRLPVPGRGDAIRSFLSITPSDTAIAYVGHSVADEDAFRALDGRGLTVLVTPLDRFTAAQTCLQATEDFIRFLQNWIRAAEGEFETATPGHASRDGAIAYFPRQLRHVTLHRLWASSRLECRFTLAEQSHLERCEECRAMLEVCMHSASFGSALKELRRCPEI